MKECKRRQDLRDSVAYMPHCVVINAGDFADLKDCDVIVNSVGKIEQLLTEEELATFHECCDGVRNSMEHLKDI